MLASSVISIWISIIYLDIVSHKKFCYVDEELLFSYDSFSFY